MEYPDIITPELIAYLRSTYRLCWNGTHGWSHWMRVCENGLRIARLNGANQKIIVLFAFTHDMARENEHGDYLHGPNAARRIREELAGRYFELPDAELALLVEAVELHTNGLIDADLTVQTCWDADRLDLNRVGIKPAAHRLCTIEARDGELMAWANARAEARAER